MTLENKKQILDFDKQECCGCGACMNICPNNCIKMIPNKKGFLYPIVDYKKCVSCKLCEKVCLCLNQQECSFERLNKAKYYISNLKDDNLIKYSQSGGISLGISMRILNESGVVYGCIYNENNIAIHKRIDNVEELFGTCGSKYVQSDTLTVFKDVYADLTNDKKVLFTGTSCQIKGLLLFLNSKKVNTSKLYSIDIICHGVPSPAILSDYIKYIENIHNKKITSFNMRDRSFAPNLVSTITFDDDTVFHENLYSELFYSNIALRDSCSMCKFTCRDKPSDLTISDTVGLSNKYTGLINENNPSSIAIVHSKKGEEILSRDIFNLIQISEEEFSQPNLYYSTRFNKQTNKFWDEYLSHDFDFILKKYTSFGGIKYKVRKKLLKILKRW